jgi:hypothetical protein
MLISLRAFRQAALLAPLCAAAWIQAAAPAAAAMGDKTTTPAKVDVALHGRRFEIGDAQHPLTIIYLRGTPYECGYAHGKLCAKELHYFLHSVGPLMFFGLGRPLSAIDGIWKNYEKHMRPEYLEELRGLADGSGESLTDIERVSAVPDISEWHCTFFAASGPATKNHETIQIRALDYETHAGIQKYPAIVVEEPKDGVPFANIGWCANCGMVTGMNARGISMSEIGDDWDWKTDDLNGRPLNYVMREVVQFSRTLPEALASVQNAPRTTSLLYCISDGKTGQVRALKTSHDHCFVYSPKDLPFPTKPGLVYMSMGMDSNWNKKVGDWLNARYGKIDVQTAESLMQTLHTGGLHAVVMRAATGDIWVANATKTEPGYTQPFFHFNLKHALADSFFKN